MAKIRVYALAKELGLESKRLLEALTELGVTVRSHASSIDDATANAVRELLADEAAAPAAAAAAEAAVAAEPAAEAAPAATAVAVPPKPARRAEVGERPEGAISVPPVVTVMGHVDHGKTTLLDKIRESDVVGTEHGGITQHIGASEVTTDAGRRIIFLDTPGHEAFTAMRARGAQVTDIVVLVVAADDGVMPQTIEAINHATAAGVPVLVAINKMDLADANMDRAKQQLADRGLVPEDWGGDTICVPISALSGEGVSDLLDMILLVADMRQLWADPAAPLSGVVIEAELDRSRGPLATILVRRGTLRRGDAIICGQAAGKVRAMVDAHGRTVSEALPGTPVEVVGLSGTPEAGDDVEACPDLRAARAKAEEREAQERDEEAADKARVTLEELFAQVEEGERKQLNLILKGDVWGSVEALEQSLERVDSEFDEIEMQVLSSGVGPIIESDVQLAVASDAIIIGFHAEPVEAARKLAEHEGVQIRLYRVIYEAIDDVRAAMKGMLEPIYREVKLGQAEVRQLFRISRVGVVAGCRVTEGVVRRGADIKVMRDGEIVHEGKLVSLRHVKDDVNEMAAGSECGIAVPDFRGWAEGDVIEVWTTEEVPR
ncbi:MAG: translation initiation factor IF-2 [Armatimonadota bacterium]